MNSTNVKFRAPRESEALYFDFMPKVTLKERRLYIVPVHLIHFAETCLQKVWSLVSGKVVGQKPDKVGRRV